MRAAYSIPPSCCTDSGASRCPFPGGAVGHDAGRSRTEEELGPDVGPGGAPSPGTALTGPRKNAAEIHGGRPGSGNLGASPKTRFGALSCFEQAAPAFRACSSKSRSCSFQTLCRDRHSVFPLGGVLPCRPRANPGFPSRPHSSVTPSSKWIKDSFVKS